MTFLHERLRTNAQQAPDRPALHFGERTITFAELDAKVDAVAAALQRGGLRRGDRVALYAANSIELVITFFAVLRAGGAAVPVSPMTKAPKLLTLLQDCSVQAVVVGVSAAKVLAQVVPQASSIEQVLWIDQPPVGAPAGRSLPSIFADPGESPADPGLGRDDLAAIIYTSGTTSTPKGAMLLHRNFTNTTAVIASYLENDEDDVVMCALPLAHTYGLFQVLVGVWVGHAVALEASFAYPFDVLTRMQDLRVTGFAGVPALYSQILQIDGVEELDLSSLRYLTNAAGPLPPAQVAQLRALFPQARLFPMYGMTECSRVCFLDPDLVDVKIGSVGRAIENCEAYVVDPEGRRVGPGVVGELVIRGANVMPGYWRRPEETERAFLEIDVPGARALRSGDLFRTDEEGLLYFVGRCDDVFKCKGEKISPAELEKILIQVPAIAEAAVVGAPMPSGDMEIVAVLVMRNGVAFDDLELRRHCRAQLENYAIPSRFETCASLPKTESGKLDRRALSRMIAAAQAS